MRHTNDICLWLALFSLTFFLSRVNSNLTQKITAQRDVLQRAIMLEGELTGLTQRVNQIDGLAGMILANHQQRILQLNERIVKLETQPGKQDAVPSP